MGLNFRNSTNAPIYVAYAYPNFSCSPVNYAKIGWYRVDPGQTREVWKGYAGGNTFYYYAESSFGRTWSGSYYTQIPNQAFHWCWNVGCTTCRNLGMRRIPVSSIYANYTIDLVTSTSQRATQSDNVRTALPSKQSKEESLVVRTPKAAKKVKQGTPITLNRRVFPEKLRRK
ncbi:DUF1036 domain-containing protein [Paenibacillus sp. FSL R10-2782]|uniref:DUF1036 domain-containing protein n=1 Tax=Paenibacillus terrae TaxID=159743 RepID=A0A4U2Q1L7_9BACL|nr:DUF1036 domain-containing protein [Paenibacillus terrae]TKH45947.1 DUF1036 domain-containing protein [Paenibacillus terrae]